MTASEVSSLLNSVNRDDGFLSGNGILIILFFLIFLFNGNNWGNGGNALTQAELQAGLYNQTTDANLRDIRNAQCSTNQAIMENRYDNALQTQTLSSQLSNCCCENRLAIANQTATLQATMTANTQAILDKMCQSEIQNLRDEVAGYRETLSNANQTQNLLNAIGTWRANPPYPYYPYGYYGTTLQ